MWTYQQICCLLEDPVSKPLSLWVIEFDVTLCRDDGRREEGNELMMNQSKSPLVNARALQIRTGCDGSMKLYETCQEDHFSSGHDLL